MSYAQLLILMMKKLLFNVLYNVFTYKKEPANARENQFSIILHQNSATASKYEDNGFRFTSKMIEQTCSTLIINWFAFAFIL